MTTSTNRHDTVADIVFSSLSSWNDYGFRTLWTIKNNRNSHFYDIFCLKEEEIICCTRILCIQLFFDLTDKERTDFADTFNLITDDNFENYKEIPGVLCSLFRDQTGEYISQIIKLQKYLFYSELDKYKIAISAILSNQFLLDLFNSIENLEQAKTLKTIIDNRSFSNGMLLDEIYNLFIDLKFHEYTAIEALSIINNIPRSFEHEIGEFISSITDVSIFHLIATIPLHFLYPNHH